MEFDLENHVLTEEQIRTFSHEDVLNACLYYRKQWLHLAEKQHHIKIELKSKNIKIQRLYSSLKKQRIKMWNFKKNKKLEKATRTIISDKARDMIRNEKFGGGRQPGSTS